MNLENAGRLRFLFLRICVVAIFAVLGLRLWDLQIISAGEYAQLADQNRYRLVPIDAPRGIIYDRFGRILVQNVPSFTVSIVPAALPDDDAARRAMLERVGQLIEKRASDSPLDTDDPASLPSSRDLGSQAADTGQANRLAGPSIEEILATRTISPYAPVPIAHDVDRQAAFILEEEHLALPGVVVSVEPLRHYVDGPLTSHLLGYVGNIPGEVVDRYLEMGYSPDDQVGLAGIEYTQQTLLKGIDGRKHIEVDAFEREVNAIASEPPVQGSSILLTIDLELQRVTEEALRTGMRAAESQVGVCIVMDPRTGEILSMVSLPSYDNNLFAGGISYADYAMVSGDPNRPLVNHAISGQYPPGSTFKIVPAAAALEEGVIDPHTRFVCQGTLWLPNREFPNDLTRAQPFYCWHLSGHGSLDILGGVRQSCDIFFYQSVGGYRDFQGLGIDRLAEYAALFGFGEPTKIELTGEAAGLLPSDRWKRHNYDEAWYTGDTYNAAIGQGYILATPLQVLNAAAAIANGGTLYRPQLVYQVSEPGDRLQKTLAPEPIRELGIADENLALIRQGMREAVTIGTAWKAHLPGLAVAGKTGTAEYPAFDDEGHLILDEQGNLPTHAWFTAFAPYEDPEIALVVFLQGGGEGSQVAVPVAAEILRYYFALPPA